MFVTVLGIANDASAAHFWKARLPMFRSGESISVTCSRFAQPLNAPVPEELEPSISTTPWSVAIWIDASS